MTFNANQNRSIRDGLNDQQKEMLTRLEQVTQPTDTERGVLRGLRLMGTGLDVIRAQAVADKWESSS